MSLTLDKHNLAKNQNRLTEHAELEEIHRDHRVQVLVLHRTPKESHHVPKSVVQMLLELRLHAVITALGSLFSAQPPSGGRTFS